MTSPCNLLFRRTLLGQTACGFGTMALQALLPRQTAADQTGASVSATATRLPLLVPRAKRVIFVFMQGGPSHVDSFDCKPELIARHGQSIDFTGVRFGDFGKVTQQKLMQPLWKFRAGGQSGKLVSDLFPEKIGRAHV